jgi:uncharacterized membrane protein
MNFAPITEAPLAVKIHLATVIPAFGIGTWLIFFSIKGAWWHRRLGAIYLALMTVTAVAAFFIRSINSGGVSPIHLFIPLTFFGVFGALWHIRHGNIRGHRNAMLGLYIGGLLIAGGLTLLPGRLLHRVFLE